MPRVHDRSGGCGREELEREGNLCRGAGWESGIEVWKKVDAEASAFLVLILCGKYCCACFLCYNSKVGKLYEKIEENGWYIKRGQYERTYG